MMNFSAYACDESAFLILVVKKHKILDLVIGRNELIFVKINLNCKISTHRNEFQYLKRFLKFHHNILHRFLTKNTKRRRIILLISRIWWSRSWHNCCRYGNTGSSRRLWHRLNIYIVSIQVRWNILTDRRRNLHTQFIKLWTNSRTNYYEESVPAVKVAKLFAEVSASVEVYLAAILA